MNINATLIIQAIVFGILVWFTMRFVWPPLTKVLDERAEKIASGLAAAEKAKSELAMANRTVADELDKAKAENAALMADAKRRAVQTIEEAKSKANEEGAKILAAAKAESDQLVVNAREALREQVAALAVKGAEQILRKEINPSVHADLLGRLKAEL